MGTVNSVCVCVCVCVHVRGEHQLCTDLTKIDVHISCKHSHALDTPLPKLVPPDHPWLPYQAPLAILSSHTILLLPFFSPSSPLLSYFSLPPLPSSLPPTPSLYSPNLAAGSLFCHLFFCLCIKSLLVIEELLFSTLSFPLT